MKPGYYLCRWKPPHEPDKEKIFHKALWWNGNAFLYHNNPVEVIDFIDDRYDFYIPCMNQDHLMEQPITK